MCPPQVERLAVEKLQKAGLTEYEAKCFVALSQLSAGTAADVSEISDIPRTRVYDLAENLSERGLVEISDGTPREFRAVSTDLAISKLQRRHAEHLESAADALQSLSTPDRDDLDDGVWTIDGQENVLERGQYLSARAEEELFGFFSTDATFRDNCFRQAQYAIDRGVDVILGSSDADLRENLREEFPEATIWTPTLDWETLDTWGTQLSRLVMVDRRMVMLASLSEGDPDCEETAVWSEGIESELVLLCRNLIGTQIDERDERDERDPSNLPL